jgi:hypothetical protein
LIAAYAALQHVIEEASNEQYVLLNVEHDGRIANRHSVDAIGSRGAGSAQRRKSSESTT